tara:strand:- start:11559 stop:12419 length:861 start_codon:yes stop_codon:yes gene_type:complete
MKNFKKFIKKVIKLLGYFFVKLLSKFKLGRLFLDILVDENNSLTKKVLYKDISLEFYTPNDINLYRVESFNYKEPDTIDWIDNFKKNSIFWDVGSNIGLFSCYAARKRNCMVFSFEPSVFNLEILCKNINLNNLNEKITIMPLPISDAIKNSKFKLSSLVKGGAISTFGEKFTYDGTKLNSIFEYRTTGISINEIIKYFNYPKPDYLKIDVDGIEHLILSGGGDNLREVKEILVEVDEKFDKQFNQVNDILNNSGFRLIKKILLHNEKREVSDKQIFNQIWIKNKI